METLVAGAFVVFLGSASLLILAMFVDILRHK